MQMIIKIFMSTPHCTPLHSNTLHMAFINYLDNLNLMNSLKVPLLLNQTTHEQILSISVQSSDFDPNLLNSPNTLKDFVNQFQHKNKIFNLQKRYNNDLDLAKKNSFFSHLHYRCFLLATAVILLMVTSIVLYIICRHAELKSLVTSLALQKLGEVDAVTKQEHVSVVHDIECTCKIQWYTICMLIISILGIVIFVILNTRKLKLFREHLF